MRVLIISPHYPPELSGVGDYAGLLTRHLAQRKIDVTVVTSASRGRSLRRETAGVSLLTLRAWGWASLAHLTAIAAPSRYDLVHIQYQNEMYGRSASICALPLLLRLIRPGLPVVVTVHDYGTPWPLRLRARVFAGPYGKAWFAAMLLTAARVILTNEQDEWRFINKRLRYPIPRRRYTMIPVGTNLPIVTPPVHVGPYVTVGYFGFVNAEKGVDTLLDAFVVAHRERPTLRLVLICALEDSNAYQRGLMQRLDQPELRGTIEVTGTLDADAAATVLASCDIVALPFNAGLSLRRTTLVAALTLGRAVITTRSPQPPAALRDGFDLILVPAGDAVALACAITRLADDPVLRDWLGGNARRTASAYAWSAIAQRTEEVYRDSLDLR